MHPACGNWILIHRAARHSSSFCLLFAFAVAFRLCNCCFSCENKETQNKTNEKNNQRRHCVGMGTEKLKWLFLLRKRERGRAHACGCVLAQSSSQHLPNEHICMHRIVCESERASKVNLRKSFIRKWIEWQLPNLKERRRKYGDDWVI